MKEREIDITKLKILVCCHKECELPENSIFFPVQVGAALTEKHWGIQRDDQVAGELCDNISSKNKSYCELTAMYWAWKNIKKVFPDIKYIGLNHYRRFFSFNEKILFDEIIIRKETDLLKYKIDNKKISNCLLNNQIIISKERVYPYPLSVAYAVSHISTDFWKLRKCVHDLSPEYDEAFTDILLRNNTMSHYNMFIMAIDEFDKYCEWLFKILAEMEKRINISNYSVVQGRIFGYMAERLLNVWLCNKNYRQKMFPVYKYSNESQYSFIKRLIVLVRNKLSFWLNKPLHKKIQILDVE